MPKMKTNKSVRSRIKVTKNGKVKRQRTGRRHLMTGKSGNKKRKMRKPTYVHPVYAAKMKTAVSPGE